VLSYLSPARAAAVLDALPSPQQADALERLSLLGETDAESVNVVEQELAAWVAAQSTRRHGHRAGDAVNAILSAADAATRDAILANLKTRKHRLAATWAKSPAARLPLPAPAPAAARRTAPPVQHVGTQLDSLRLQRAGIAAGGRGTAHRPRRAACEARSRLSL
jgi:hypothetical protein